MLTWLQNINEPVEDSNAEAVIEDILVEVVNLEAETVKKDHVK